MKDLGHGALRKVLAYSGALCVMCAGQAFAQQGGKTIKVAPLEKTTYHKVKLGKKQTVGAFAPQIGHNRRLTSMSISSDGALLATASGLSDGLIKVWDLNAGQLLHTLDSEDFAALSPDGKWVAGGNVGGPIKVWNVGTGELVKTLDGSGPVSFAGESGEYLVGEATPSKTVSEGTVEVWQISDWSSRRLEQGHEASLSTMSVSTGGKVLATGSYDDSIKLWDVKSGQVLGTFKKGVRTPSALAVSKDLAVLAVGYQGKGGAVELWDLKTAKRTTSLEVKGNITSLAFAPDGATLAGASTDGITQLWGMDGTSKGTLDDGGGQVVFSPDSSQVIHGYQAIVVSDVASKAKVKSFAANDTQIFQTVFTPDNKYILTTDARESVEIWDIKTGGLKDVMTFANGTADAPEGELVLSPDGDAVVLRPFVGGELKMWSIADAKGTPRVIKVSGLREVRGVTFAPGGKELVIEASGKSGDGTKVVWWDLEADEQLNATTFSGYVSVNGFVDDGKAVALVSTGTGRGKASLSLKLWDKDSGLINSVDVKDVEPFGGDIDLAASGSIVALGDVDNSVKLWDRETKKIVGELTGHSELVNVVSFSPDGRLLATGSWDETVKIWDASSGKELLELKGILYQAQHISFSPHDDVVAISHQGWLKLIHLPTGRTRDLYYDEQGDKVNWLIYDGSGHFDCMASGCDMVMYRGSDGEMVKGSDKRLKKLKGVEKFGK